MDLAVCFIGIIRKLTPSTGLVIAAGAVLVMVEKGATTPRRGGAGRIIDQ